VVADRGMVSQATLEAFEKSDPPVRYIVGVRMRRQKELTLRCLAAEHAGLKVFRSAATQRILLRLKSRKFGSKSVVSLS
jgi:hypothetical protein